MPVALLQRIACVLLLPVLLEPPATCSTLLIALPKLLVPPGSVPRSRTLPLIQSTAWSVPEVLMVEVPTETLLELIPTATLKLPPRRGGRSKSPWLVLQKKPCCTVELVP